MVHLLDLIHEYQLLKSREEHLGLPLDDEERVRLVGLSRLLHADEVGPDRRMIRLPSPLPVQFTVPGGFGGGALRNISAGGMAVSVARPPPIGMRTIIRIAESAFGTEYVFPARVVWTSLLDRCMGLAFDGVPLKASSKLDASWRRNLRFGAPLEAPMSA